MEFLGFIGSNSRHNLREIATVKSEENADYWHRFITGQPLPKPKTTFATEKFMAYMNGVGINVKNEKDKLVATPMTTQDIHRLSSGELKEPLTLSSKNLEPEDGGLFDVNVTGGLKGTRWSHYKLAEPIVNPTFEAPVQSLLGLKATEFEGIHSGTLGIRKVGEKHFQIVDTRTGEHVRDVKL